MLSRKHLKMAWELLDRRERRNAFVLLMVVIIAGLSAAAMVGSILPFLTVLADPSLIEGGGLYSQIYEVLGFTSTYQYLIALGAASLSIIVVSNLLQILRAYVSFRFALGRFHSISCRLIEGYLAQQYEFFLHHHSSELSQRVLDESSQVIGNIVTPLINLAAAVFTVSAVVMLLLAVEPILTISAFGVLGCVYGLVIWFSRRYVRRIGVRRFRANTERYRIAVETFGGVKDIKLLGREVRYYRRFQTASSQLVSMDIQSNVISEAPHYVMQMITYGIIIALCLILLDPVQLEEGNSLAGVLPVLGFFALAGQRLMPELQRAFASMTRMQYGLVVLEQVHADLQRMRSVGGLQYEEVPAFKLTDNLRFSSVSYSYPNAEGAGLHDVSFEISRGEKIGIVGTTGAGKTTLADVALGLLRPSSGQFIVDGTLVNDDNIRSWQRSVGYVPQDIFLVDASIRENIALGLQSEDIDDAQICKAACMAQIDDFVRNDLPEGYDTTVGERGVRLSGGQKQRIGIARALYHDADLIVFDEATSALDNLTERDVMEAIDALPGNVTVLMIAHRLTTVQRCDRILVLDKGQVVGFDTWDGLMAENAAFRKIAAVNT